jgi:putative transposase
MLHLVTCLKRLRQLCDLSSKLWNEVNYARLKAWLEKKLIDFKGTYKEFYEKYKTLIGSTTAQQILNIELRIMRHGGPSSDS